MVLVIDGISFSTMNEEATNFFFQVINDRYEKAATIVTTTGLIISLPKLLT
ncbi:hypothetical protein EQZ96_09835 [Weissella cibaria]|nr:hypothetical protein EQZ96_09835 [Weissella cibaria]